MRLIRFEQVRMDLKAYANRINQSYREALVHLIQLCPVEYQQYTKSEEILAWIALKIQENEYIVDDDLRKLCGLSVGDSFKYRRNIYNVLLAKLKEFRVIFLLGPRRSGKTVCLKQLNHLPNMCYINFKEDPSAEYLVVDSIRRGDDVTYLLDEVTYSKEPEMFIRMLAGMYVDYNPKVNIVFTGSQSIALHKWGSIAFSSDAAYIYLDFMSYSEWLTYKDYNIPTAENYNQFLLEISDFYGMHSLEDYLQGCLDETVKSNEATYQYLFGNECDRLNVSMLVDVLYTTLFSLHNHVSLQKFQKAGNVTRALNYSVSQIFAEFDIDGYIKNSFLERYNSARKYTLNQLEQAFVFLRNCGLITVTCMGADIDHVLDIDLEIDQLAIGKKASINIKDDLFVSFNFFIRYPMFYVAILKDILGDGLNEISNPLLGSIVECHARSMLPSKFTVEYRDAMGNEVDYVNTTKMCAIEFKATDKVFTKNNFSTLPDTYTCMCLSRTLDYTYDGITYVPFYKFLSNYPGYYLI